MLQLLVVTNRSARRGMSGCSIGSPIQKEDRPPRQMTPEPPPAYPSAHGLSLLLLLSQCRTLCIHPRQARVLVRHHHGRNVVMSAVRDNLRHASISTTSIYLQGDEVRGRAKWARRSQLVHLDGSQRQANCRSILPARRRTGPTTIFTSCPSLATSSSSFASLTPRNCPRVMREILDWSISSSAASPCCPVGSGAAP